MDTLLPNEEPRIVNGRPEGQLDYEARQVVRELVQRDGRIKAALRLSNLLEDEAARCHEH